jgi:flavocytochrome c
MRGAASSIQRRWDREIDVLVVGAGGAGLCAATSAAELGAKVTVLEKRANIGGNTIISGGRMNVAGSRQQARLGIEDSVDRHFEETWAAGDYVADPELVRILVRGAKDVVNSLESHGMEFREDHVSPGVGGLWPRGIIPVLPAGTGYINAWKDAASSLGVNILLRTRLTEIIREGVLSGKVLGARTIDGHGRELAIKAKSLIIAAGGFAGDVEFRTKYDHRWRKEFPDDNYPSVSAEAFVIASDIGADLIGMDYIQLLPTPYDLKAGMPTTGITSVMEDQMYLNSKGQRIVKADAKRDKIRDAIYSQQDHMAFQLCDERGRYRAKEVYPYRFVSDLVVETSVKSGKLFRATSIREVAEKAGIDPDGLEKTVANFNEYVDQKLDRELGQKPIFLKFRIEKPPFYVWPISLTAHYTLGGLRINTEAQVLDRRGKVIRGLYAAGEVTGGIHGTNRVGGNSLLEIHVFGIIAGRNAAREALGKEILQ